MTEVWLDAGDTKNLLLKTFNARLKPCMGKLGNTAAERLFPARKTRKHFLRNISSHELKVLFTFAL